jgi:hypothetical protein
MGRIRWAHKGPASSARHMAYYRLVATYRRNDASEMLQDES